MGPITKLGRRSAAISALLVLLSACAVSKPVSVNSTILNLQTANSVEFPAPEAGDSLRSQWRAALGSAFASRSVSIQSRAPFIVDFALSVRKAETGVAEVSEQATDVEWRSAPRKGRFLDKCEAQRLRGTLVIFRRADGQIIYRGESEADDCDFDQAAIDAMADELVFNAVGR